MATPLPVLALSVVLGLGACSKSESPEPSQPSVAPTPTTPTTPMNANKLQLTWSATPSATSLAIAYKVENKGTTSVFVANKLEENGKEVDRLVVMNGADAIRLVRGVVMPDAGRVLDVPPAIFVELAAGQSLESKVELPLPLVAWHNAGPVTALKPTKKLVLEVAITETKDGPPTWLVGAVQPAP